ncbi:hypothetical protein [Nocardioides sp. GY 10127]|uniref:hypothetical protein n=1 Tax=Nocardioides sp. GY 10127 TaxID=2569762 RepID=UPI0010A8F00D|nr:hypothetical protein [Nocardioides sp. GY 10127]TIC81922.1 hypothetical protein E8D37_12230 [Nocardioides sp. GY 10127]
MSMFVVLALIGLAAALGVAHGVWRLVLAGLPEDAAARLAPHDRTVTRVVLAAVVVLAGVDALLLLATLGDLVVSAGTFGSSLLRLLWPLVGLALLVGLLRWAVSLRARLRGATPVRPSPEPARS